MILEIVNESKVRVPRKFIENWMQSCVRELLKQKVLAKSDQNKTLTLVFLDVAAAKKINSEFRKKNYATDVLSFDSMDPSSLGELVLCSPVLKKQANEHGLTYKHELGYMLLHGLLHLKGYDHELGPKEAELMFDIQDRLFERLLRAGL